MRKSRTPAAIAKRFRRLFAEESARRAAATSFAGSIEQAAILGASRWSVTLRLGRRIQLNVGRVVACELSRESLWLGLLPASLSNEDRAFLVARGQADRGDDRRIQNVFERIPEAEGWRLPVDALADALPLLESAHVAFLARAMRTGRHHPWLVRKHSSATVEYLNELLGTALPAPEREMPDDRGKRERADVDGDADVASEKVAATDFNAYQIPLLKLLREQRSSKADLVDRLHRKLGEQMLPGDTRVLKKGAIVWRERASWALAYLRKNGEVIKAGPDLREITPKGLERLHHEEAAWSIDPYQRNSQARVHLDDGPASHIPPATTRRFDGPRISFKEAGHDVNGLLKDIELGELALPDIQRPFVWRPSKVRDLFDSMYRGFPVGSLMFWSTHERTNRPIGTAEKRKSASQLVIDGQQRLTSLYSVITGKPIVNDRFEEMRIEIAFRPRDGLFAVTDAAVRNDPEFVPSISDLWTSKKGEFHAIREFIERLKTRRELPEEDVRTIEINLSRLFNIVNYPFTTLEIARDVEEEAVADIFVRINNGGSKLGQSDFVLTLVSVFSPHTRRDLEDFARRSMVPSLDGHPSPFNPLIAPQASQLLRVAIAYGFHRARLLAVYQLLRGKDPATGDVSAEHREAQFHQLEDAIRKVLDLNHWSLFVNHIRAAGFHSQELVSSENALLYSYAFYLIGKLQCGVGERALGRVLGRWFFAASLSARYSGQTETTMEEDLGRVRDLRTPDAFVEALDAEIATVLTNDFWEVTLPQDLATSSRNSPVARVYLAAQVRLGARVLFSDQQIATLLDPLARHGRKAVEAHHLFPKAWLRLAGIKDTKQLNQVANLAFVEWPDNAEVSDASPAEYVPRLRQHFPADAWERMYFMHALPQHWENLPYDDFLQQRRRLMANVIRRGFEVLGNQGGPDVDVMAFGAPKEVEVWNLLERVEVELRALVAATYQAKWGAAAEARLRRTFSAEELARIDALRQKHTAAYPLSAGRAVGPFLDYVYLNDLARLVTSNEIWAEFSAIFEGKKETLDNRLKQITPVRNDQAHHRRVPENELLRCKLACDDLLAMVRRGKGAREKNLKST